MRLLLFLAFSHLIRLLTYWLVFIGMHFSFKIRHSIAYLWHFSCSWLKNSQHRGSFPPLFEDSFGDNDTFYSYENAKYAQKYRTWYKVGRVMRKGPGRHDTWFRVICIWNNLLRTTAVLGFSFKRRFLRFQLLFPDFYHFHHVVWRMKWAKTLKSKNGQNMSSGPFSHDAAYVRIGSSYPSSLPTPQWREYKDGLTGLFNTPT